MNDKLKSPKKQEHDGSIPHRAIHPFCPFDADFSIIFPELLNNHENEKYLWTRLSCCKENRVSL